MKSKSIAFFLLLIDVIMLIITKCRCLQVNNAFFSKSWTVEKA